MQRARVANTTLLTGARADHSKSLLIRPGPSARQVVNVPSGKQRHPAGLWSFCAIKKHTKCKEDSHIKLGLGLRVKCNHPWWFGCNINNIWLLR